ncbi:hypothetical protein [Streptomyces sp. NPDC002209]|uniref:hypothetical protein n=1 Tax=Streptomyces sp. NPDC002209 TaxID=3364638 RepID=UPI0036BDB914
MFDRLRALDEVLGIAICGSHRLHTADALSDTDAWVFVDNAVALSEAYCTDTYLAEGMTHEILSEGRDHSDVEWVVFNVLTEDGILNLKFLTLSVLSDFCARPPSLDTGYMEDLENYWTMDVAWEKDHALTRHQRFLGDYAVRLVGDDLVHQIVSRYASTYWRSVFQGFLRDEVHAWRFLVAEMIKDLCDIAHLQSGRLPAPRKWAFSRPVLGALPIGAQLTAALAQTNAAGDPETDKAAVLEVYRLLADIEGALLSEEYLHREFWWRSVFFERISNLPAVPAPLRALAASAPRPLRLAAWPAGTPQDTAGTPGAEWAGTAAQ